MTPNNVLRLVSRLSEVIDYKITYHEESNADDVGDGKSSHQILDHRRIIAGVAIHEEPGTGNRNRCQGTNVNEDANSVAIVMGVKYDPSHVNTLAVVPNARTDS